jgi:CDP-glucose 4,6-dehydratase
MENLGLNSVQDHFYNNKKVFVTGHTGFKGAWLACWLNQMGSIIKGYALEPDSPSLFNLVKNDIACTHVMGDIRDKGLLQKEILDFQPDIIFHLAAQALVRRSYEIPAETFEVNVTGTAHLLEAVKALDKKCTVVIVTSDKVYENKETDYHYKETDLLGGYDPYSASKAATEMVVSSFRNSFFHAAHYALHQKTILSARAGNVIGGGDWSRDRIIPDIVRALKNNEPVEIRNPASIRPWQHVLEPLGGYLHLAMLAHQDHEKYSPAYNFGPRPEDHLPVSTLVETAIHCWGNGSWKDISDKDHPHEAGLLQLDISKAESELHWHPKLDGKEAIRWTMDWYKGSGNQAFGWCMKQIEAYLKLP